MNNFEKIKTMNAEKMARMLQRISMCATTGCEGCPLQKFGPCDLDSFREWLMEEAE